MQTLVLLALSTLLLFAVKRFFEFRSADRAIQYVATVIAKPYASHDHA